MSAKYRTEAFEYREENYTYVSIEIHQLPPRGAPEVTSPPARGPTCRPALDS